MSTKKIYDLAVAVGSYEVNGETRHRYQTIGAILQKDDGGKFITMERSFNPAGIPYDSSKGNSFLVSMFEPKPRDGQQSAPSAGRTAQESADDDIPF